MKVYVNGAATELQQSDFVAKGGEGQVFRHGDIGYKIYHDPKQMLPLGKLQALQRINNPDVIRPLDVVKNAQGQAIGYTMRFVDDAWILGQTFPRPFRDRNGLTHALMLKMVQDLQGLFESIHQAGVLLVDANELNFLVTKDFRVLLAIDTDSYQVPQYPATAIMASVRDWTVHGQQWTELSDWFSFACVSFQMFTGLHPFKGKHPTADNDMVARMKAGISVLDPEVQIPPTAYDFSVIPLSYMAWYRRVLGQGLREPPPSSVGKVTGPGPVITGKPVTTTDKVVVTKLFTADSNITGFWHFGSKRVIATATALWVDRQKMGPAEAGLVGCFCSPVRQLPVAAVLAARKLMCFDIGTGAQLQYTTTATEAECYDGRLYGRCGTTAYEVAVFDGGTQLLGGAKTVANIMPNSSKLYRGALIQNMLGAVFVSIFAGKDRTCQVRMPELDRYKIMDARYEKGVLMVVGESNGKYDRLVFRFNDTTTEWDLGFCVADIQPSGLNFTVLDSGVCVCLDEAGELVLFSAKRGATALKRVQAPGLPGDAVLGCDGGTVLFSSMDSLYSMKLK